MLKRELFVHLQEL